MTTEEHDKFIKLIQRWRLDRKEREELGKKHNDATMLTQASKMLDMETDLTILLSDILLEEYEKYGTGEPK